MINRSVRQFADKADRDLLRADLCDRKADGIPVTAPRKLWTGGRVTEVAEFSYLGVGRLLLLRRSPAISPPSRAQRQARRMGPGTVVHDFARHKKRASQSSSLGE